MNEQGADRERVLLRVVDGLLDGLLGSVIGVRHQFGGERVPVSGVVEVFSWRGLPSGVERHREGHLAGQRRGNAERSDPGDGSARGGTHEAAPNEREQHLRLHPPSERVLKLASTT